MPRLRGGILVAGLVALVAAAPAWASSLYRGPAPRPGPDILYRPPATAPQLTSAGIWHADPILISGASAYRDGEFLYQDYLYDDHGAHALVPDLTDPSFGDQTFSAPNGTYTYPTKRAYAGNAADLVELRVKPLVRATAFRITLNTLENPSLAATTIAIGNSSEPVEFPNGANASAPARLFLTVHGETADLVDARNGHVVRPEPTVDVHERRRQIEVLVSHAAWDPGRSTVPMRAGVGLWDAAHDRYKTPGATASTTEPGGSLGLLAPAAFFNVAFRFDEPWQHPWPPTSIFTDPAWWRDRQQGRALARGDLTPFSAKVDFGKLEAGVDDDMADSRGGVPTTGPMDRILASHFETEQGVNWGNSCDATKCVGELTGQLQPYAIYVPKGSVPERGYGLTLLLHSLGASYNQFGDTRNQSEFGERARGSIVITPAGRGPDGWYYDHAAADTFEVWADVASRYQLDPGWTSVSGYSMGGYGTYKFSTQYPDLFARAQPVVGPPGNGIWIPPLPPTGGEGSNTNRMLASVRHIPFMIWDGTEDELVPVPSPIAQARTFDQLGYRYVFDLFALSDHFALAANDEYGMAADFLGTHRVHRDPAHVTYVVNPTMDFPDVGTVADHAYWLSGLKLRDASGEAPLGSIDALSGGMGERDAAVGSTKYSVGLLTGGHFIAMPYLEQSRAWGPARHAKPANVLHLDAANLAQLTVHLRRAGLDCDVALDVATDGPLIVHLAGCGENPRFH